MNLLLIKQIASDPWRDLTVVGGCLNWCGFEFSSAVHILYASSAVPRSHKFVVASKAPRQIEKISGIDMPSSVSDGRPGLHTGAYV